MTKILLSSLLLISLISCNKQDIEDEINIASIDNCQYEANVLIQKYSQCGWFLNETVENLCASNAYLLNDYATRLGDEILCREK